jgi:hypothetical protein
MLVWDGEKVVMMNPVTYAVGWLGERLAGQAEQAGFADEDDVADYITARRRETRAR